MFDFPQSELGGGRLQLSNLAAAASYLSTRMSCCFNVGASESIFIPRSFSTCAKCASRIPTIAAGSSWKFVEVGALGQERFKTAPGYSERAGHRYRTIFR